MAIKIVMKGVHRKDDVGKTDNGYRIKKVQALTNKEVPSAYLQGTPHAYMEVIKDKTAKSRRVLFIQESSIKYFTISEGCTYHAHLIERMIKVLEECGNRLAKIKEAEKYFNDYYLDVEVLIKI